MSSEKNKEVKEDSKSFLQSIVDSIIESLHHAQSAGRDVWATVTARASADAQAIKAAANTGSQVGFRVVKRVILLGLATFAVLAVILATAFVCLWLAGASAFLTRYYTLSRVPGNHVVPLSFNTMPLYTEWWRNHPIDDAMANFIPKIEYASGSGSHSRSLGVNGEGGDSTVYSVNAETPEATFGESHDDLLQRLQQSGQRPRHRGGDASGGGAGLAVQTLGGKLLDYKVAFLQQYASSLLATSTMYISTGKPKTLFLPGGSVNMEAVFDFGSPMFSAQGVYSGRLQLVFLREDIGRDLSVVVESAMLFAEDPTSPQPLLSLDVLFTRSHSLNVRTGELPASFLARLFLGWVRILFYVPVKVVGILQRWIEDSRSAPFTPIDHDREVAVSIDIYERFTPPLSLQRRLRAMNFTVYYNHLNDAPSSPSRRVFRRPIVARMTFYSHVQLRGFTSFLSSYPIVSFFVLTGIAFAVYLTVALTGLTVGGAVLYFRLFQRKEDDDGDQFRWKFDQNASFSSSGLSPTTPMMMSFAGSDSRGVKGRGMLRAASAHGDFERSRHSPLGLHSDGFAHHALSSSLRTAPLSTTSSSQVPATQAKKAN